MSRPYEAVYIFDSALDESQINERLERFHALLKTPDRPEPVTTISHWGKRTLAYPVEGKEVGYYVVAQFETDPSTLSEYERLIKLDEQVLRQLIVVNDGLAAQPTATVEEAVVEVPKSEDENERAAE